MKTGGWEAIWWADMDDRAHRMRRSRGIREGAEEPSEMEAVLLSTLGFSSSLEK